MGPCTRFYVSSDMLHSSLVGEGVLVGILMVAHLTAFSESHTTVVSDDGVLKCIFETEPRQDQLPKKIRYKRYSFCTLLVLPPQ
jgi:hypothetical protein